MDQQDITPRFRVKSTALNAAIIIALVGLGVTAVIVLTTGGVDMREVFATLGTIAVLALMTGILGSISWRHGRALRALRRAHPDGIIFLARRLPTVVSDLESFMDKKGYTGPLSDGWVPALVDERGISVWTADRDPTQILLMEWEELGEIAVSSRDKGAEDPRALVTVDVQPYLVPLTAELGGVAGLLTLRLDRADAASVVAETNARRPAAPRAE